MQAPIRRLAAVALAVAAALAGAAVPTAGRADNGQELRSLRHEGAMLAARSRSAVLELYALDSALGDARAELGRARAQAGALERRHAAAERRLRMARRTLAIAQRLLAERLRALYEEGGTDPLEVLLGARSLDEAMTRMDGLTAIAEQDREIIEQTSRARRRLGRLTRSLAARERTLLRLERAAAAHATMIERTRDDKQAYLRGLVSERRLGASRISALEARAESASVRAASLAPAPTRSAARANVEAAPPPQPAATTVPAASAAAPAAAAAGRTLTVTVTGYAISGRTATGVPTGWGVVAVDPSVIPLGTRMTIPGYGEGVAADVGGAVRGATIDVWFPSRAQALAWGRRTVTVTLH